MRSTAHWIEPVRSVGVWMRAVFHAYTLFVLLVLGAILHLASPLVLYVYFTEVVLLDWALNAVFFLARLIGYSVPAVIMVACAWALIW